MRKILVSFFMLFFIIFIECSVREKRRIDGSQIAADNDFFITNPQLEKLQQSAQEKKYKRVHLPKKEEDSLDALALLADVPRCIDSYNNTFKQFTHELRHEFFTKQSVTQIQQLYITELTRLGWNVEIFSMLKEFIIIATKPSKKILIILDEVKGSWFSKNVGKVIVIVKEQ